MDFKKLLMEQNTSHDTPRACQGVTELSLNLPYLFLILLHASRNISGTRSEELHFSASFTPGTVENALKQLLNMHTCAHKHS